MKLRNESEITSWRLRVRQRNILTAEISGLVRELSQLRAEHEFWFWPGVRSLYHNSAGRVSLKGGGSCGLHP